MRNSLGWRLGLLLLFPLVLALSCGRSGDEGVWVRGKALLLHFNGVEKVDKVAYANGEEHFVIRPRQPDNTLAAILLTVVNQYSSRILMLVDEEAATLADARGNRFSLVDPFEGAERVSTSDPEEGRFSPFLWGDLDLPQGFQVAGWIIFEVPAGSHLTALWWDEADEIRAGF